MSDIISSIIVDENNIFLSVKASDVGPFSSIIASVGRASDRSRFVHFPNEEELDFFLEAIGYEPEDRFCFASESWDDNAIAEYDLIVWAKDVMDIPVHRNAV